MVNLFRLFIIALGAPFRDRKALLEPSVLKLRVWPFDLDLNLHVNNGRYLSLMDLGRVDLMVGRGLSLWSNRGRQPLVAASFCRHFKPLKLFQAYELHSRIAGWDEKWMYIEHRVVRGGRLHTLAAVKAVVVEPAGPVPTRALLADAGGDLPAGPPLPAWIQAWLKSERAAIDQLKSEGSRP